MQKPVIHWFRNDLRIKDNSALNAVAKRGPVIPIYIIHSKPQAREWSGSKRQSFLCQCLDSLNQALQKNGTNLHIVEGQPAEELARLCRIFGASAVSFNKNYDPYSIRLEGEVTKTLEEIGISVIACRDRILHEPAEVYTKAKKPFIVFTPFYQTWSKLEKPIQSPIPPDGLNFLRVTKKGLSLPTVESWGIPPTTLKFETPQQALARSLEHLQEYPDTRNIPSISSSQLSPHLRFGTISTATIYRAVANATAPNKHVFLRQLAWREFFIHLLYHFPHVLNQEFNPTFLNINWEKNPSGFERWKNGETGFPIVDAGMRELNTTGFMHNRVRMIVSMFLTKDLRVDWRLGEKYFMQNLIDGEIASNNGGWQWSAGTGADAAPYFRIQNPWLQTKRFDREGLYIKHWLPELRDVPPQKLWQPTQEAVAAGYPRPIVDHAKEKEITLAMFKQTLGKS